MTLCGLLFYRGMARFIASDETKGFGGSAGFEWLHSVATGSVFGVPTPFVLLIIISILMWVVLHRSVYGRYLFAVGRNETAARYSGINAKLVIGSAYVLAGLLAGIAGIVFAFYTNSISPSSHGNFFELLRHCGSGFGWMQFARGRRFDHRHIIGTALLQVLQNLVNLLGIPSSLNFAVMGAVILIGVIADQVLQGRVKR